MKMTAVQSRLPVIERKKGSTAPAKDSPCPIAEILKIVGKRWTLLIW
jgi:DNA-binding HxlR family transcriptional regulator